MSRRSVGVVGDGPGLRATVLGGHPGVHVSPGRRPTMTRGAGKGGLNTSTVTSAAPQTPPSAPDDALFDSLLARYRDASDQTYVRRDALRAMMLCSTSRMGAVLELLRSEDQFVQAGSCRQARRMALATGSR